MSAPEFRRSIIATYDISFGFFSRYFFRVSFPDKTTGVGNVVERIRKWNPSADSRSAR